MTYTATVEQIEGFVKQYNLEQYKPAANTKSGYVFYIKAKHSDMTRQLFTYISNVKILINRSPDGSGFGYRYDKVIVKILSSSHTCKHCGK